jgi:hypothetical protein
MLEIVEGKLGWDLLEEISIIEATPKKRKKS